MIGGEIKMQRLAMTEPWQLEQALKPRTVLEQQAGQSRLLGKVSQIFPLTLFPDELIIEELRVVWIKKMGPWTNEIVSIMATDIACVYASRGLLFGHIHVKSLTGGPDIFLDKITRFNAYKVRSLIEGIALSAREGLKIQSTSLATERASLMHTGKVPTVH